MNGIRFYLEFQDKSKRQPGGNIVAVLALNGAYWSSGSLCYEAIAALFEQPDSPVAGTGVALDYLRQRCQRVCLHRRRASLLRFRVRLPIGMAYQSQVCSYKATRQILPARPPIPTAITQ
jgi:hypothetical protein